jgi:hypothetical protein
MATVDGAPADGAQLDPSTNAVTFAPGRWPAPGAHVRVSYRRTCAP